MKKRLPVDKAFEWAWRAGCLGLLLVNLWLKDNFVTKEVYERDRKETVDSIKSITLLLTTMEERDKVNDRQDKELADHEGRLRALELRRPL